MPQSWPARPHLAAGGDERKHALYIDSRLNILLLPDPGQSEFIMINSLDIERMLDTGYKS